MPIPSSTSTNAGAVRPVGLCLTLHCPLAASGRDGYCQRHRHGGGSLPDGEPLTVAVAGREVPVFLPAWIPAGHTLALVCDHLDAHASRLQDTVTDLAATRRQLTSGTPLPADALCVGACGSVADLAAATAPLPDGELFQRVSRVGPGRADRGAPQPGPHPLGGRADRVRLAPDADPRRRLGAGTRGSAPIPGPPWWVPDHRCFAPGEALEAATAALAALRQPPGRQS